MDAANFVYEHPFGPIYGWFGAAGLRRLVLPVQNGSSVRFSLADAWHDDRSAQSLGEALEHYFAGAQEAFDEIPLDLDGATPFRRAVWETARSIRWGRKSSYGELARLVGKPDASRAVGQALGANPIPIIVPCHRFLSSNGDLGGFSAGLHWKRELLRLEGALSSR